MLLLLPALWLLLQLQRTGSFVSFPSSCCFTILQLLLSAACMSALWLLLQLQRAGSFESDCSRSQQQLLFHHAAAAAAACTQLALFSTYNDECCFSVATLHQCHNRAMFVLILVAPRFRRLVDNYLSCAICF